MEITVGFFLLLLGLAIFCEFVDSAFGMGYGTILSPTLLILGFDPHIAIPPILISQAFGGFLASLFHHKFQNSDLSGSSKNLRIVLLVSFAGIAATIFAAMVSLHIPKKILKTYIGSLVIMMGIILLRKQDFFFSWKKMIGIGVLSSFNKGLSGGGFGPIVTGGQIISGQDPKEAIGTTTLAEAPICIIAFFTYLIAMTAKEFQESILKIPFASFTKTMFSGKLFQWELILALSLGSLIVAPFGALATRRLKRKYMNPILGGMIILLGIWTLGKTHFSL